MVFYLCPPLLYYTASVTLMAVQALSSLCRGGTAVVDAEHVRNSSRCDWRSLRAPRWRGRCRQAPYDT